MIAVKIENLSKQYRLGTVSTRTLSHDLNRWWTTAVLRKDDPYLIIGEGTRDQGSEGKRSIDSSRFNIKNISDYIWALKDINLEVQQGEVLGIIGKNGAGKSTLLKILSKVTPPTKGTVKAHGRIASLLEVGTGFHTEMTGRENIFMNGSILGMTKAEILGKFDEIVYFAGVEQFIDTPVKRYSSGMLVRLGFAVAAHLDPEILVIDEVLAVGDAEFQKKAIGKMQDISKGQGRTVLFVSHNMAAVLDLCNKAILLQNGCMQNSGTVNEVVANYMRSTDKVGICREWLCNENAPGNEDIKLKKIYTINPLGEPTEYSMTNSKFGIYIEYEVLNEIPYFTHGINVYTSTGIHLFSSHDNNKYNKNTNLKKGLYFTIAWIPGNLLQEGDYLVNIAAMRYDPFMVLFHEKDLIRVQVIDTAFESAKHENCRLDLPGIIRPMLSWDNRIFKPI